jgi:hypothetical protein
VNAEAGRVFDSKPEDVAAVNLNLVHPLTGPVYIEGAFVLAFNVVLWIGLVSNYRRAFWRAAGHALRRGQIDAALGMGLVAYQPDMGRT